MALSTVMFSDFVCPFCYVGFETVRRLRSDFDLAFQWRGFEIHPELPVEGMSFEEFEKSGMSQSSPELWQQVEAMAAALSLTLKRPKVLYSSRFALKAGEYAAEQGKAEAFDGRLYRAYFEDARNIADREVILGVAREVGLDPQAVSEAIDSPRYTLKLKNNAMIAHRYGIGGVPAFVIENLLLIGAQSEEVMRRVFERAFAGQTSAH